MSKHLTEGRMSKGGQNDPSDMGVRPPAPHGSGGKPATMTPGPELDAAVLRAIGFVPQLDHYGHVLFWTKDGDVVHGNESFSTDPNGHEALRLCGPWLDEHTQLWEVKSERGGFVSVGFMSVGMRQGSWWPIKATRAEAICRLVLAIAEREGT